jgi:hypothetical protein
MIQNHIQRKEVGLQSIHNSYQTRKNSYMFRQYTCNHHQVGYRALNRKLRTKCSKICKISRFQWVVTFEE